MKEEEEEVVIHHHPSSIIYIYIYMTQHDARPSHSFDWNAALRAGGEGVTLGGLLGSFMTTGFQATNFAQVKKIYMNSLMRRWKFVGWGGSGGEGRGLVRWLNQ